jgi:pyrroloquinoline-quinone synthase
MSTKVADCLRRFDEEIERRKYTRHSWTQFVLGGRASAQGLKRWAIQKYHQTFLQIPIFSIVHSRAESVEIRRFMVDQLIDEETSLRSGGDAHYILMRRFAVAMGATEQEITATPPGAPVLHYVEEAKDICRTEHPVVVMASMYAGERQTAEVTGLVLQQLRRQFDLNDDDLEWFVVHAGDDEHADAERDLIERLGGEVEGLQENGLRVIDRFITQWGKLQDFYYAITTSEQVHRLHQTNNGRESYEHVDDRAGH